jgi:hypothetical protein
MAEKIEPQLQNGVEGISIEAMTEQLLKRFAEAELFIEAGDREGAKIRLPQIYSDILTLNKRNQENEEEWAVQWAWNPDGDLTEDEFNQLLRRRKLLSNAIGIMTASGVVRHNLNEI